MAKRYSPTSFKSKGGAIAFFVVALALLIVVTFVGIGMLTRYDYSDMIPEDAPLRANFPDDNDYQLPLITPTPMPEVTPTPLPTPMPTPASTPIPLTLYSQVNKRMMMPKDASAPGEGEITSLNVSVADESRTVVVTGWAFLNDCDAQQSDIYLVVSPHVGEGHRFYAATVLPGSSGVQHAATGATNLERADFRAVFSVSTYDEGPYKLGLLVVNESDRRNVLRGYFDTDPRYSFNVKRKAVTSVGR